VIEVYSSRVSMCAFVEFLWHFVAQAVVHTALFGWPMW
jgi:hypothetical protein